MARDKLVRRRSRTPAHPRKIEKLESFTTALADGVVTKQELAGQEQRLAAAMKALEPALSDELHAKVTTVLVELSGLQRHAPAARAAGGARAHGVRQRVARSRRGSAPARERECVQAGP